MLATGSVSVHYEGAQELTASGERFDAKIAPFSLAVPTAIN